MRIIGITGTLGAGKGTVAAYLETKGFRHYSAREFIAREVERRGLPVNRETLQKVANGLRAAQGPGYIATSLFQEAQQNGQDAIIESIRTVAGVKTIQEAGGTVLAVDADPRVRYERIRSRGSETDQVSFERFLADEAEEMAGAEPHLQNLSACIAQADYKISNNGTIQELHPQIDAFLSSL